MTRELQDVTDGRRPFLARLTDARRYATCAIERASPAGELQAICGTSPVSSRREAQALRSIADRLRAPRADTPGLLHLRALWLLHWPASAASYDEAVDAPRTAVAAADDGAELYVDLAVALTGRAAAADRPADLVEALDAIERAVALDSASSPALFNRALILGQLHLVEQAIRAWTVFLHVDGSSGWASEARTHVSDLQRLNLPPAPKALSDVIREAAARDDTARLSSVATAYPAEVREYVELGVLPGWADAVERRDPGADSILADAAAMARAVREIIVDEVAHRAVLEARKAAGGKDGGAELAAGLLMLRDGVGRYREGDAEAASRILANAVGQLRSTGSSMVQWADYYLALSHYQLANYDVALALLEELAQRSPGDGGHVVGGSAFMVIGLMHAVHGRYGAARKAYGAAVDVLSDTRHSRLLARAKSELAYVHERLGLDEQAWRGRLQALSLSPTIGDPLSRHIVFVEAARAAAAQGASRASVPFFDEAVRWAGTAENDAALTGALWQRAIMLARSGNVTGARADLDSARRAAKHLAGLTRTIVAADIALAAAQVERDAVPQRAVTLADEALATFQGTGYALKTIGAHLVKAASYLRLDDPVRAEAALALAVTETERGRSALEQPGERAAFLDAARPVVDALVALRAIDLQRPEEALALLEHSRARGLLERLTGTGNPFAEPLTVDAIQRRLGGGELLVVYASLPTQLLVWGIASDTVAFTVLEVPRAELTWLVTGLHRALRGRAVRNDFPEASRRLYETALGPVRDLVASASRVVVIPDGPLHLVPFAALMGPSGRFLAEVAAISAAPSASAYLRSRDHARTGYDRASRRLVAIGNPQFDRNLTRLEPLPGAEREAARVASLYPQARVLLGASATRPGLLKALSGAEALHFAGHAVVHSDPSLSHLLLAPSAADSTNHGFLTAREIGGMNLGELRTVVLSACQTGVGSLSAWEGPSSLAAAFLAAGVRTVIASLWVVEDERTADFFEEFHHRWIGGEGPAEALRAAQVAFVRRYGSDPKAARVWGAFVAIGG